MRTWVIGLAAAVVIGQGGAQAQMPDFLAPAPIPSGAPAPGTPGFIAWWTAHGPKRAPTGYHYDPGSYVISPNDACWREELVSPGGLASVNASAGKPNGVSKQVVGMTDLATADSIQLASIGIHLPSFGEASISCHVTLRFNDGGTAGGIISFTNPGQYAPIQVSWISDLDIAAMRAKQDGLRISTKLYVKPNLTDPAIQACVGRETALGAGEQFPGQLWAGCADKLKTNR
jgi:hypothetical protein